MQQAGLKQLEGLDFDQQHSNDLPIAEGDKQNEPFFSQLRISA